MGLSSPDLTYTIPSIYDDTVLDCRIYLPKSLSQASPQRSSWKRKGAILAHPYAPLGGSFDDPIVGIIGGDLLKEDFIVATFNFRGAAGSRGRTSWTGNPECEDYMSVAGCFTYFLHNLEAPDEEEALSKDQLAHEAISLIIGGYSYGSIITTHLPNHKDVLSRFASPQSGSAAAEIRLRAEHLASQTNTELRLAREAEIVSMAEEPTSPQHTLSIGGEETPQDQRRRSREERRISSEVRRSVDLVSKRISSGLGKKSRQGHRSDLETPSINEPLDTSVPLIKPAYLLISPLLPPIASLTAIPFSRTTDPEEDAVKFRENPTLAVFGGKDVFTSSKKICEWATELEKTSLQNFKWIEVKDAGHFWHEDGAIDALRTGMRDWIESINV